MKQALILTLALSSPVLAQRGRSVDGDTWKVLAERYDTNKDSQITDKEYTRGPGKFLAYDANADGVLTAADFEGSGSMDFSRRMLGRSLRAADGDEDGQVSAEEWQTWLASLGAGENGVVPPEALPPSEGGRRGGFSRGSTSPEHANTDLDRDKDGTVSLADLAIVHALVDLNGDGVLAASELDGRPAREGTPKVGEEAPDFELVLAKDPETQVRLSSFTGKRPVALVFGSYT